MLGTLAPMRIRTSLVPVLGVAFLGSCVHDCEGQLEPVFPRMAVTPTNAELDDVPDEQDTKIVFQITALTLDNVEGLAFKLDPALPEFSLQTGGLTEVLGAQTGEINVVVRPEVPSTLTTKLIVTAASDTRPNKIVVPITVNSIDAGLPKICGYPAELNYTAAGDSVGEGQVARLPVPIKNCGTRDLILDHVGFFPANTTPDCSSTDATQLPDDCGFSAETGEAIHAPFGCDAIPQPTNISPSSSGIAVLTTFHPADLAEYDSEFAICSNDTRTGPVVIPATGQAQACPTACFDFVDGTDHIQPFDQVRIDGTCSTGATPSDSITTYNWSLKSAPTGNQQTIVEATAGRAVLEADLAGQYCVQLDVVDTNGVSSCAPVQHCFSAVPTQDLQVQLVWDSPTADFDLHMIGDGGAPFTHNSDCYFSNRHPTPTDCPAGSSPCSWVADVDQNPNLDHDDNNGYGPENTSIAHPAPGSKWKIFVHYWAANTDGSPASNATVRVFCYGHQVIELTRNFPDSEQMWQALELTWPQTQNDPCQLSQIGVVEPFANPFGGK